MRDLKQENGDLVIDPETHDLEIVSGIDEIAQRIQTTLDIRYGEMDNLDPEMGADYSNFLGKNFNEDGASADMEACIEANVPEVDSIDNIEFEQGEGRQLLVTFDVTATVDGESQEVKVVHTIGD